MPCHAFCARLYPQPRFAPRPAIRCIQRPVAKWHGRHVHYPPRPTPAHTRPCAAASDPPAHPLYTAAVALLTRITNLFPLVVLSTAAAGLIAPTSMAWFKPQFLTAGLALIMLGMGATLTIDDLRDVLTHPGRIAVGCILQYTVMPTLGYCISLALGLPLPFAIGLRLVACCPGGTASNVVTFLAGADVPLSVMMTTASTLLATITTPLLTTALVGKLVAVDAAGLFVSTLQVVLAPVLLGVALNKQVPALIQAIAPFMQLLAVVMVALVCGSVVSTNAAAVRSAGPVVLAAVVLLHLGGFFFGYAATRAVGLPERVARTNSIEVGMQNSVLGAFLAAQHFADIPLAAVPCVLSACTHTVVGSLAAAGWRASDARGNGRALN